MMNNPDNNGENREVLSACPCFGKLSQDELDFLLDHCSFVSFLKGETICKEGGFSSGIKYILDGFVKVYIEGPSRRNIVVKLLVDGDFIGLSSLYGNTTYSYSSAALSDSRVLMISREAMLSLISGNGKFALDVTKWYCMSYEKAYTKLASIGFKNLPGRIADVLLYLEQQRFAEKDVYSGVSRKCMAEMAGVPVESAVRILSEFDRDGIISHVGKGIVINDYEMLKKYSRGG